MNPSTALNLAFPIYAHSRVSPGHPALVVEGRSYSYQQLARRAQAVADWCRDLGKLPRVAVLASRSLEAYAGLLGVAWAGGAYLPISPR